MPDFDLHKPSPDAGHEGIRRAVLQAIAELDYNVENVDVSFELTDMLFVLLDQALSDVAALDERVAVLEAAHAPPPV